MEGKVAETTEGGEEGLLTERLEERGRKELKGNERERLASGWEG